MKKTKVSSEEILRRISRLASESPRSEAELRSELGEAGIDPERLLATVKPHVPSFSMKVRSANTAGHINVGSTDINVGSTDIVVDLKGVSTKGVTSEPVKSGKRPYKGKSGSRSTPKSRLNENENPPRS